MTISTTSSTVTVACTGAESYSFPMIGVAASDINVFYTATNGTVTNVSPAAYTVALNAPVTGNIWGIGGTVSPSVPSNYTSGSLTIARTLPFTQNSEIGNQGNQYPIVTETALDTLCMEIQQVAARTGAYRGVWVTGSVYNFGDVVQDGVNGAYTNNIYVATHGNTSGVWATDLAAGDWVLAVPAQFPAIPLPLTIANGGTGETTASTALTALGGATAASVALLAPLASPALTGAPTAPTQSYGNNSTKLATTAFVQAAISAPYYPVGSIYISMSVSTSPATILGFGTWVALAGVCLVGVGTGTDSNGATQTFTAGTQVGEYVHTLSSDEMPSHTHIDSGHDHPNQCYRPIGGSIGIPGGSPIDGISTVGTGYANLQNTGGGGTHNNVMPVIGAYMWYRSA